MVAALDSADRERYYHWCTDLVLAGEDYKVNEIICFAKNENDPLADFAQVKKYDMGFLLILLYTEDKTLIAECMDYAENVSADFDDIELRTPYPWILESDRIRAHYSITFPEYPANPVYYIHSSADLTPIPENKDASVSLFKESDKFEIARAVDTGIIDAESMNVDMFVPCTNFKDVKWYILRVNGKIAGYLRGECGYANIYDIGWLYVETRFRGHGYAADLVQYFSKDMFANGAIPHYGYAISEASSRVAEKCGYICDKTKLVCRSLKPMGAEFTT